MTAIIKRSVVKRARFGTAQDTVRLPTSVETRDARDKLFAPMGAWGRFRRLHAYSIDHDAACRGPRDSEDARFNVVALPYGELDRTTVDVLNKARLLMPGAVVAVRDHRATCPHCKATLVRRSLLITLPFEDAGSGELTKTSREYAV